jgi:hypothetical protein
MRLKNWLKLTLVDVARVGLLPGLGALLLLAGGGGGLLASLLLLGGRLASRGLAAGGGSLLGFGRHFGDGSRRRDVESRCVGAQSWTAGKMW